MSAVPRSVIVRTPSWDPQTFHLGPLSAWELQRGDAIRCGCTPLTLSELVAPLEEGRGFRLEGRGCWVTYRVESLLE
jgi:hypothetical protein